MEIGKIEILRNKIQEIHEMINYINNIIIKEKEKNKPNEHDLKIYSREIVSFEKELEISKRKLSNELSKITELTEVTPLLWLNDVSIINSYKSINNQEKSSKVFIKNNNCVIS
ncbi:MULTISPECIES: hypothetical protein [Spiroplasma]|uniref:Uncharacterized protein n=1 Tax=Spiroplasma ixodetis TaxID=2141 RepID=A0ABM8BRM6_9MOLU|nr:hypothetical protein [Spiroplasma ixodetis]BDT02496.1 hypothetical protein SHM_01420 [Spiroplasma ixodetis]